MARLLVVYGTTEGHTRKIAEHIGKWVQEAGHGAVVVDSASALPGLLEEGEYDGAIVCGSVHQGKHSASLRNLLIENRADLSHIPTALVSVSLASAMPDPESQAEARGYADALVEATGWKPRAVALVAGALLYSEYDFMKRMMVRLIASSRGARTDASRNWEYTDWRTLRGFVDRFLAELPTGKSRTPVAETG